MFTSMELMETLTGKAYAISGATGKSFTNNATAGKQLLKSGHKIVNELEILADSFENSNRKVVLVKVLPAYKIFEDLIIYYGINQLLNFIKENTLKTFEELTSALPAKPIRNLWQNIGGQLIPTKEVAILKEKISNGKIKSWEGVHDFYVQQGNLYQKQKLQHAMASLFELTGINLKKMDAHQFGSLLNAVVTTKEWMTKGIHDSRSKDYTNPYRKMVYENMGEMNEVMGKLEENSFIKLQIEELKSFKSQIASIKKKFKLKA